MNNILKLEFDEFLSFYRSKIVDIDLNPPSIELEQLKELEDFKSMQMIPLGNLIMSNIKLSRNDSIVVAETNRKLRPVRISYKNNDICRQFAAQHEFRITSIINDVPRLPIGIITTIERPKRNFENLETYTPVIDYTLTESKKRGSFQIISLAEPSVSRKPFWINLYPIPLNPISPINVKEFECMDLTTILLIPISKSLERLREVPFEPVDSFKLEIFSESNFNVFEKKCVINLDALNNDVLIDFLQSLKWKIYERTDNFMGIQTIQVCEDQIIAIIQLETIQTKLKLFQQFKNLTVILEVKDQK